MCSVTQWVSVDKKISTNHTTIAEEPQRRKLGASATVLQTSYRNN